MRHTKLLWLALTVTACGIPATGVSTEFVELSTGVVAVIVNRTAEELEMTFSTEGEGHSSEGSGTLPSCNATSTALPAASGDSWQLWIGGIEEPLIQLDSSTRPDLMVPAGSARRVEITVTNEMAAITQNVLIDRDMADNLGNEEIPDCP